MDAETKAMLDAIEARWRKTTPGPIDVHRIDNHDGSISYQLQQAAGAPQAKTDHEPIGARVLTEFDDIDNLDARYDAEACAKAYEDVPALVALVKEQEKRITELEAQLASRTTQCLQLATTSAPKLTAEDLRANAKLFRDEADQFEATNTASRIGGDHIADLRGMADEYERRANVMVEPAPEMVERLRRAYNEAYVNAPARNAEDDTMAHNAKIQRDGIRAVVRELVGMGEDVLPDVDVVARASWIAAYGTDDYTKEKATEPDPAERGACFEEQRNEAIAALGVMRDHTGPIVAALRAENAEQKERVAWCSGIVKWLEDSVIVVEKCRHELKNSRLESSTFYDGMADGFRQVIHELRNRLTMPVEGKIAELEQVLANEREIRGHTALLLKMAEEKRDEALERLAKVEGPPAPGTANTRFLVLHKRDDAPWAVYPFETFTEARIAYEQFASSWTGTFLVRIVMGPNEEVAAEAPLMPRIFDELMGELRVARECLAKLEPDAEAWRKGQDVLRELQERVIPCGHKVEDFIGGGDGSVTKCGACLAAKQANGVDHG